MIFFFKKLCAELSVKRTKHLRSKKVCKQPDPCGRSVMAFPDLKLNGCYSLVSPCVCLYAPLCVCVGWWCWDEWELAREFCDTLDKDPVARRIMGYLRNREKASSCESKEQNDGKCKS